MKKSASKNLYHLKDVTFKYKLGSCDIEALRGISLEIPEHSLTTFSGPSGSGKSTLMNLLGLIEPFQKGHMTFQSQDVKLLKEARKNQIRKFEIGFIFQQFHLIPVFTAEENVAYFLSQQNLSKAEIKIRTEEALTAVGLIDHRMKRPSQLSGGQRQRVAIARALAKKPAVIIGDEPTGSLDQKTGREIMTIFNQLVDEKQVSIILTTHDPMVQGYSHKNFHIQDGLLSDLYSSLN